MLVALGLPACTRLLSGDDYAAYRRPPERLHEIETVRLKELSRSKPVSVEEAAADPVDRAVTVEEQMEAMELGLVEVRAAALANNFDLKVELVSPSIAQETIREEEAQFEALLFGSAAYDRTDQPATMFGGVEQSSRFWSYDGGLRVPLRTGGTITMELPFSKYDDDTSVASTSTDGPEPIDPLYRAGLEFSISQPLLRKAGIRTNTHFIRVAKFHRDIADARTKLAAIRILAGADRAYWLLFAARRELEVRRQQYELALQQLEQAQRRVAAGAAPEIEIMRAESGVAARLEAIIVADTDVRRRERDLKRVMNRDDLPMESPRPVTPLTDPNPVGLELDAEKLAEYAIANRMELLELELQLAVDASTIDYEHNLMLPLLSIDAGYAITGLGGSFNDSFRELGNHEYADYSIGLSAEVPLGNHAARARHRRAVLERIRRLATREQRRQSIRQEVLDAVDEFDQNWQRILAARQEVILAGRTYEAEKRQFEVGLRTSTEVLEAAARLAGAQSREIWALTAYEISQVDIALAAGALLGHDGVVWEPKTLD